MDNAIKFSKPFGILSIHCSPANGEVCVLVRDTGIGMTEEVKQRAFDKFYQGERSHSVQGSGLGLALVKRIVTLCGGSISLESTEGEGTTFTVRLPLDSTAARL